MRYLVPILFLMSVSAFPQTTDNFDSYADASELGNAANWNVEQGMMKIYKPASDGEVDVAVDNDRSSCYYVGTWSDDQSSQGVFIGTASGMAIGVSVRNSGTASATYYGWYSGATTQYLFKMVSGAYTALATASAWTAGDVVKLEVEGTELRCYRNGSLDVSISDDGKFTDASIGSGNPGFCGYGNSTAARMDDWEGDEVSTPPPAYDPPQYRVKYNGIEYKPRYNAGKFYARYGTNLAPAQPVYYGYRDRNVIVSATYYCIPEDVVTGDYVGDWIKNWSYINIGGVYFELVDNYNGAFDINSSTGRITVADQTKIAGQFTDPDNLIYALVRSTELGYKSEIDTAWILVKESAKCTFFNYGSGTNGDGTRGSPKNDITGVSITTGNGYFFLRGTVILNEGTIYINSHIASADHPTVFGAYGTGAKPRFRSTVTSSSAHAFYLGTYTDVDPWWDTELSHRAEYVQWYDIQFENYYTSPFQSWIPSCNFSWLNCTFNNCNRGGDYVVIHANDMSYVDSANVRPFTFVNCRFDTTAILQNASEANSAYLKIGAGPCTIKNCYFGPTKCPYPAFAVRLTSGKGSKIQYSYIEPQSPAHGSDAGCIQLRHKNTLIEENRIVGSSSGIFIVNASNTSTPNYQHTTPDNLTIRNNYFDANTYVSIFFRQDYSEYWPSNDNVIEDNYFKNCETAIFIRDLRDNAIRRNVFDGGTDAIFSSTTEASTDVDIYYNVAFGQSSNVLEFTAGTSITVSNNTFDGSISVPASGQFLVRNCFFKSTTVSTSNNLDIDNEINPINYFVDYAGHNYALTSLATDAINHGVDLNYEYDIAGNPVDDTPDIGAYQYVSPGGGGQAEANDSILYETDFESPVAISDYPYVISGIDDWLALEYTDEVVFNISPPQYTIASIEPDPENASNNCLYGEVIADDPGVGGTSRFQISWRFEGGGWDTFHVQYRMYLSPDIALLENYTGLMDWFTLMEMWEQHNDAWDGDVSGQARWIFALYKASGTGQHLCWKVDGVYMQPASVQNDHIWPIQYNCNVPVILGEWFTLDYMLVRGQGTDGRILISVTPDGGTEQQLFDIHNYTEYPAVPLPIWAFNVFKIYANMSYVDYVRTNGGQVYAYYDDLKILGVPGETAPPPENQLDEGIVSYWKFDEASGNATDVVGGHTGTASNITYSAAGKLGNAFTFNGSSSVVTVPSNAALIPGTGNFTIAMWVKSTYTGAHQGLWSLDTGTGTNDYSIYITVTDGYLRLIRQSSVTLTGTHNITDGNWHLVIITREGDELRLYTDGSADGSDADYFSGIDLSGAHDISIGRRFTTYWFNGSLDGVGYWSRAFTITDAQVLWNSGNGIDYPFQP